MLERQRKSVIDSIVIPTADRPESLRRCLDQLCQNLNSFKRDAVVIVGDDSTHQDSANQNSDVVRLAAQKRAIKFKFLNRDVKVHISMKLEAFGVSKTMIDFMFGDSQILRPLGAGGGGIRNLLLLATRGESFISLDDDTQVRFVKGVRAHLPGDTRPEVSAFSAVHHRFFASDERSDANMSSPMHDLVGMHQNVLGQSLPLGTNRSNSEDQRILSTVNGIVGDCGWGSPSQFLFIDRASLLRIAKSDEIYAKLITSRNLLKVSAGYAAYSSANSFMSTAFGIDGRCCLAPFFPKGRGSDIVFGIMLELLNHGMLFADLPYAILHTPVNKRSFWKGEVLRSARSVDMSSLLSQILMKIGEGGATSLKTFGNGLVDVSMLPAKDFLGVLHDLRNESVRKQLLHLEQLSTSADSVCPAFIADVKSYISLLLDSKGKNESVVPIELLRVHEIEQAISMFRRLTARFGELLTIWEELQGLNLDWDMSRL